MDSFFGIGIFELIIIAIIALVVMGPERLPGAIREMSKYARMIRDLSSDLQSQFGEELQMLDEMNPKRIVNDLLTPTTPAPPAKGSAPAAAAKPVATAPAAPVNPAVAAMAAPAAPAVTTEPDAGQATAENSILPPALAAPPAASPSSPPAEEGR